MFKIGDIVEVLAPFNIAFPDKYPIEYIKEDGTCGICVDRDFSPEFLKKVDA